MSGLIRFKNKVCAIGIFIAILFISALTIPYNAAYAENDTYSLSVFTDLCLEMAERYDSSEREEIVLQSEDFEVLDDTLYLSEDVIETYNLNREEEKSRSGFYAVKYSFQKKDDDTAVVSKNVEINRLVVLSDDKLPEYGAVMSAKYNEWNVFQYTSPEEALNAYNKYSQMGNVQNVSYDWIVSTDSAEVEVDTVYTAREYNSWGAEFMGWDEYRSNQLGVFSTLPNVYVAVLDTGINTSHVLFNGRIDHTHAKDFVRETVSTSYGYEDRNGHGTHVSGTIAEATESNVKIVPYKVLGANGKGSVTNIVSAVESIISWKNANPDTNIVINMSLGIDASSSQGSISASDSDLEYVVRRASMAKVIPVVSAGNESTDTVNASPANVYEAITVSALKISDRTRSLTFDSSYSNYGAHVDFSAPGTGIESAWIGDAYETHVDSGTSMAAPHVTACVALVYSNPNYQNYTQEQVENLLKENSVDLGSTGKDIKYGWGCIDMSNIGRLFTNKPVSFHSNQQSTAQSSVTFTMSYDEPVDGTVEIYYTTDESATKYDNTWQLYNNQSITLNTTTKYTAVAFIKSNGVRSESLVSSQIFYINNYDILSNYEYTSKIGLTTITQYKGTLKTLNVPQIGSFFSMAIGDFAFAGTSVEVLNLPTTVRMISGSAFSGNTKIKEINCASNIVEIGAYAFNKCTNLQTVNIPNITSIGNFAFADCNKITSLKLDNVTTIGNNAFVNCSRLTSLFLPRIQLFGSHAISNTGLKTILLGKNLSSMGIQEELKNTTVYGYASTGAYEFAIDNNLKFYDLTLRATKTMVDRTYVKTGESSEIVVECIGYDVKIARTNYDTTYGTVTVNPAVKKGDYEYSFTLTYTGKLTSETSLSVILQDFYGTSIDGFGKTVSGSSTATAMNISVVDGSASMYNLSSSGEHFKMKVNGSYVNGTMPIYEGTSRVYNLEVIADDGWQIDEIRLSTRPNSTESVTGIIQISNVSSDIIVYVKTSPKGSLTATFLTGIYGQIEIDGKILDGSTYSIIGKDSFDFVVKENVGYEVLRVLVNGKEFTPTEGKYQLTDINENLEIELSFRRRDYRVTIQQGVGGHISAAGLDTNLDRWGSRTYYVSTTEGYDVDFVTVNGKAVEVVNNSFTIKDVTEDCTVIISFKKSDGGLFSSDSVIFNYFIIFLILIVIFAVSKIAIYIIRKKVASNNQ